MKPTAISRFACVFLLAVALLGLQCANEPVAGGSSTEGGNVTAVVVDGSGASVTGALAILFSDNYYLDSSGQATGKACSTYTLADGRLTLDSLDAGTYTLMVYGQTGGLRATPVLVAAAKTTDLDTLMIGPYGGITGRVEVRRGAPTGVYLWIESIGVRVQASEDSTFAILNIPAGTYTLVAACAGSLNADTVLVTVEAGRVTDIPQPLVFYVNYIYGGIANVDTLRATSTSTSLRYLVEVYETAPPATATWRLNGVTVATEPAYSLTYFAVGDTAYHEGVNALELTLAYSDTTFRKSWVLIVAPLAPAPPGYALGVISGIVTHTVMESGTVLWGIDVTNFVPLDTSALGAWRHYGDLTGLGQRVLPSDTVVPTRILAPAQSDYVRWFGARAPERCALTVGDTVCAVIIPDLAHGCSIFRVRTDESPTDFLKVLQLDTTKLSWCVARPCYGWPGEAGPAFDFAEPHMTSGGLVVERYRGDQRCMVRQAYSIAPDGTPSEMVVSPTGAAEAMLIYYQNDTAGGAFRWDSRFDTRKGAQVWVGELRTVFSTYGGFTTQSLLAATAMDTLRGLLSGWRGQTAAEADTSAAPASSVLRRYVLHQGEGKCIFSTAAVGCEAAASVGGLENFFVAHSYLGSVGYPIRAGDTLRYVGFEGYRDGTIRYTADTMALVFGASACGVWPVKEFGISGPHSTVDTNRYNLRLYPDRLVVEQPLRVSFLYGNQAAQWGGLPIHPPSGSLVSFTGCKPDVPVGQLLDGYTRSFGAGGRVYPTMNVLINGLWMVGAPGELFVYSSDVGIVRAWSYPGGEVLTVPGDPVCYGWELVR